MSTEIKPEQAMKADPTMAELAGKTEQITKAVVVPYERANFKALLAANPNHFGTLKKSSFKTAKALKLDPSFEAIHCAGLQPQTGRIEAMIDVNHASGYGGDLCSPGS